MNTPELSAMISDLRKKHPQNGKIMSKEQVSLAMGKGRTWLSQIETGRLKKISSDDLIKVFEIILDIDHDEATEKVAEYYEPYKIQSTELNQLLQQFCSAVSDKYFSCQTQHEQRNFMLFLNSLYFNLTKNSTDFEYLLDGLDLSLMDFADKWDQELIHEKMQNLKDELIYLKKENILKSLSSEAALLPLCFNDERDGKSDGIKSCQNGLNLLYRLSDYYRRKSDTLNANDLSSINFFVNSVEAYSNFYYPTLKPINIPVLTTTSSDKLDHLIFDLRKHIQLMLQTF